MLAVVVVAGEVKGWIGYSERRCAGILVSIKDIACAPSSSLPSSPSYQASSWKTCAVCGMEFAFIQEGTAPLCAYMDKVFRGLPLLRIGYMRPFTSGLSLNISVVFLRFILCSRLRCSRPACLPSCLSKASCASGGSRSKRSSSRHSSRPRQQTGPGLTPRPDRASLSPSTALPSKPPPPPRKIRPSWIHSLKPSIPLLPQTM